MDGLKYLIKGKLLEEEKKLMIKYFELTAEYRKKICTKCIGTGQQKIRKCALFRGLSNPTCNVMIKNIDKKIKEKNEELMQKIIAFTIHSNAQIKV